MMTGGPDLSACKGAIVAQLRLAPTGLESQGRPSQCDGVDDPTMIRLYDEAVKEVNP